MDRFFSVDAATRSEAIEANHKENDEDNNEDGEVKKKKKKVGFRDRKVCFVGLVFMLYFNYLFHCLRPQIVKSQVHGT